MLILNCFLLHSKSVVRAALDSLYGCCRCEHQCVLLYLLFQINADDCMRHLSHHEALASTKKGKIMILLIEIFLGVFETIGQKKGKLKVSQRRYQVIRTVLISMTCFRVIFLKGLVLNSNELAIRGLKINNFHLRYQMISCAHNVNVCNCIISLYFCTVGGSWIVSMICANLI